MYLPAAHRVADPAVVLDFIDHHGFATLVTQTPQGPWASHLPLLLDRSPDGPGILRGHLARANDQWRHFDPGQEVLAIFHGPHAYISPRYYRSANLVPTWNYAVVHAYGRVTVHDDPGFLRQVVRDATAKYEAGRPNPWTMDLPEPLLQGLLKAIVGFSIRITRLEAKFKLGQNRHADDQASLLQALESAPDADSQALAQFMRAQGLG